MDQTIGYLIDVKNASAIRGFDRTADAADRAGGSVRRFTRGTQATSKAAAGSLPLFTRMGASVKKAGASIEGAGKQLTKFSIGVAAAAGAAVKASTDYEREFSKITGLVGIAADEVERMADETLTLGGRTAQAPQELAGAMFTLQSAGLRGARASEALGTAAELAAGGMGEVRTIAQAMTSTLSAYASANVTAAEAGDFLAATARAGNFEASQLAGSLGKVLPISSQLKISLGDVGGATALLTRTNGNASRSITQVAAVMRVLLAPSAEARKILDEAGIAMSQVKEVAAGPDGLVGALQLLQSAAGGSDETLARMLGSSEAISAAFSILGASSQDIADTFGAVGDAAGVAAEVFEAAEGTDSFALEQAITQLKIAAIQLGDVLAPLVAGFLSKVAGFVSDAAESFASLPGPVKEVAGVLGLLAAVAGPSLIALGKIATVAPKAAAGLKLLVGLNPALLLAAGAVVLLTKAFIDQRAAEKAAREQAEFYSEAIAEATGINRDFGEAIALSNSDLKKQEELAGATGKAVKAATPEGTAFSKFFEQFASDEAKKTLEYFESVGVSIDDLAAREIDYFALEPGAEANLIAAYEGVRGKQEQLGISTTALHGALKQAETAARSSADVENARAEIYLRSVAAQHERTNGLRGMQAFEIQAMLATEQNNGTLEYAVVVADRVRTSQQRLTTGWLNNASAAGESMNAAINAAGGLDTYNVVVSRTEITAGQALGRIEAMSDALALQVTGFRGARDAARAYEDVLGGLFGDQQDLDTAVLATLEAFETLDGAQVPEVWNQSSIETQRYLEVLRRTSAQVRDNGFVLAANGATVLELIQFERDHAEQIRQTATAAGASHGEVEQLLTTYLRIPENIRTLMVADTRVATLGVERLVELVDVYGSADAQAILDIDKASADRKVALALFDLAGYSKTEAIAFLDLDDTELDEKLAETYRELNDLEREQFQTTVLARADTATARSDITSFTAEQFLADITTVVDETNSRVNIEEFLRSVHGTVLVDVGVTGQVGEHFGTEAPFESDSATARDIRETQAYNPPVRTVTGPVQGGVTFGAVTFDIEISEAAANTVDELTDRIVNQAVDQIASELADRRTG